jgi:hypothetical protein
MLKIVSFPAYGCGGIICCLLNDEPLNFYDSKFVKSKSHNYLKLLDDNNNNLSIEVFNQEVENHISKKNFFWMGTHHHPNDFYQNKNIKNIIYVKTSTVESKVWLTLRTSLHFDVRNSDQHYHLFRQLILDFYIDPTLSLTRKDWELNFDDKKVINVELYDFITNENYRDNILKNFNIDYNKNKFNEWFVKNDLSDLFESAISTYNEFAEKIPDYLLERWKKMIDSQ